MKTTNITDEQVTQLRAEAARVGDELMVSICDIVLAGGLTDDVPPSVDAHVKDLEERGIYPYGILAPEQARLECARVISEARAYD